MISDKLRLHLDAKVHFPLISIQSLAREPRHNVRPSLQPVTHVFSDESCGLTSFTSLKVVVLGILEADQPFER